MKVGDRVRRIEGIGRGWVLQVLGDEVIVHFDGGYVSKVPVSALAVYDMQTGEDRDTALWEKRQETAEREYRAQVLAE